MKSCRIEAPYLTVEPVGKAGQGPIELHQSLEATAVLVSANGSAKRSNQKRLQEASAQDIGILADEILIVPEEISVHRGEEYGKVNRYQDEDKNKILSSSSHGLANVLNIFF